MTVIGKDPAKARARALAEIVNLLSEETEKIVGAIPMNERLSWLAKEDAAQAEVAGTATAAQQDLLDRETLITGETRADLAARIINRANLFRDAAADAAGFRRKAVADLDAATTATAVAAVAASTKAAIVAHFAALAP